METKISISKIAITILLSLLVRNNLGHRDKMLYLLAKFGCKRNEKIYFPLNIERLILSPCTKLFVCRRV